MSEVVALPPVALDAEASLIGACLLSPNAIETCADILDGNEFYRDSNAIIYRACVDLWERGELVDGITVVAELTKTGLLKKANGEDNVFDLAASAITQSNAGHYAKIIRETYLRRELVSLSNATSRAAQEGESSIERLLSDVDKGVLELSGKAEHRKESVFTGKELVERFRYRIAHPDAVNDGVPTPFPNFLRPLAPERLYVLGGYSADGKTALANQFARSACEAHRRVGFASIEMGMVDLTDRLVASFGVPHGRLVEGDVAGYEDIVEDALAQISEWDIEIIDDPELDPGAIRRAQRKGKYDLLIVDHLHRIQIKDKRHEREEISESVRRFANIAREFKIPVLLLSQLSRGFKHDPFPRPTMADVRGTSAIENEAAMILFIWRLRDNGERTNDAELIVGKNRFGAEGYRNLQFRPSTVSFHQTGG